MDNNKQDTSFVCGICSRVNCVKCQVKMSNAPNCVLLFFSQFTRESLVKLALNLPLTPKKFTFFKIFLSLAGVNFDKSV